MQEAENVLVHLSCAIFSQHPNVAVIGESLHVIRITLPITEHSSLLRILYHCIIKTRQLSLLVQVVLHSPGALYSAMPFTNGSFSGVLSTVCGQEFKNSNVIRMHAFFIVLKMSRINPAGPERPRRFQNAYYACRFIPCNKSANKSKVL